MIENYAIFVIAMIVLISLLTMLGNKLKIAYPVLLVLAGLAVSVIPDMPKIQLDPELILVIFLPPLLYESSMAVSVKEMSQWWRIIFSFAFLVVFLTACTVALLAVWLVPGLSLSTGFLLGGIVASTDAVSANVIMKYVKVPSRVSTIIETESLLNDASSLIVFSFALLAVGTGTFDLKEASLSFLWMVFGGAGIGLAVTGVFVWLMKLLPVDTKISIVFSLIAPYIMYLVADAAGTSGVLSVVSGGMLLGYSNVRFLDSTTRIQGLNVWRNFVFVLNGFAFLLIGLDLPQVVQTMQGDGHSLLTATGYGLLLSLAVVLVRMGASYGAMGLAWLRRKVLRDHKGRYLFDRPTCFIVGWSGMRGVLSLAAALSIPHVVAATGQPFPQRSLVLYLTFIIILFTLLVQGLTLPAFLKRIHFPDYRDHLPDADATEFIQHSLAQCSLDYIQRSPADTAEDNALLQRLTEHWKNQLNYEQSVLPSEQGKAYFYKIFQEQRLYLYHLNRKHPEISEELIRSFIHRIDLEEERLRNE